MRVWTNESGTSQNPFAQTAEASLGEDVHLLRRAFFQRHLDKGIKAKHLAKHCGISASMLTMLLKGDRNLGVSAQQKIESRLGLGAGCFSNPSFLKETLLCDFSSFDFTPASTKQISTLQLAAQFSAGQLKNFSKAESSEGRPLPATEVEAAQSKTGFDLSSLNQMVLLSNCQVSVETVGVKGSELTLMVKLKF